MVDPKGWNLNVPVVPDDVFDTPDFGPLGEFSLLGSFESAGIVTAVLFLFTLLLADFFDTMTAIGAEAGLNDEEGMPPRSHQILVVDSVAAAAGGAASVSSNTSYIESAAAGVGAQDRRRQPAGGASADVDCRRALRRPLRHRPDRQLARRGLSRSTDTLETAEYGIAQPETSLA